MGQVSSNEMLHKIQCTFPFSDVSPIVYDLLGREVAKLVNKRKAPGNYEATFDRSDIYYGLTAGGFVQTRKMPLVRQAF